MSHEERVAMLHNLIDSFQLRLGHVAERIADHQLHRPTSRSEQLMNTYTRSDGTSETDGKRGLWRRIRLRRVDGQIYLDRWGIGHDRIGRILVHRMQAPDPGIDLHNHPWWFVSIVVWGGYTEQRADADQASVWAALSDRYPSVFPRGVENRRRVGSVETMRLDECHTVNELHRRTCWTIVIGGPRRQPWGFFLPGGWVSEKTYDETVRADRRDLWNEVGT